MVSAGDIGNTLSQYGQNFMPMLLKWLGYFFLLVVILVIGWGVFILFDYKYTVTRYLLGKMGDGNVYIRDVLRSRGKIVTEKGVTKLKLLWSKVAIQPNFDYIYPRGNIFLYQFGRDNFLHGKVQYSENPGGEMTPISEDVKFWGHVRSLETIRQYEDPGFMERYGHLMAIAGTVLVCACLAGLVFYWAFTFVGGGLTENAQALRDAASATQSWSDSITQKFAPN